MLSLFTWLGFEVVNYNNYKKVVDIAKIRKKHYTKVDPKWMENYMLNELTETELKEWIKNSISFTFEHHQNVNQYYKEVPFDQIPKEKMLKWTIYNLFCKSMSELTDSEIEYSRKVLNKIEDKVGFKFNDNLETNNNIFFLRFGHNTIESSYRPLILHPILYGIKFYTYQVLKWYGFKKYKTFDKITYFYYKNPNTINRTATVFIHGLGIGVTPYLAYISKLRKYGDVILPILPNISNLEFHGSKIRSEEDMFPSVTTWRDNFQNILIKHNIEKINIIGHSFGTVIMGILMKDQWIEERTHKKIFVDPVCFIDQSYKIYRYINEPQSGGNILVDQIFNILVYKDIYVRYATQRFMYGPDFWPLDYHSLSNNDTLVVLSYKDQMVPTNTLQSKLRRFGIPVIVVYDALHADIFLVDMFVDVVKSMTRFMYDSHRLESDNLKDSFIG